MNSKDRRIYFLRHGLADRTAWQGSDFERPLTPDGKERLSRSAKTMRGLNLGLDLILTSPLTRAYQTAEIVARQLDPGVELITEESLACGFSSRQLEQLLAKHHRAQRIMLVGHEPDFSLTVSRITGGSQVVCKKGSLVRVDLLSTDPLVGELIWLIPPKALIT